MTAAVSALRERPALTRCPYCHDLLVDEVLSAVACPGCGSSHHWECMRELGRCAVRGCERQVGTTWVEESRVRESFAVRKLRQRMRERVGRFVRNNTRDLGERITYAMERAQDAEDSRRWVSASEAWREVAYLELLARSRVDPSVDAILERVTPQEARAHALRCTEGQSRAVNRIAGTVVASLFGTLLATAFTLTLLSQ